MNRTFFEVSYKQAVSQRNLFAILSFMLVFVLIIISCFLFLKRERVIITPTHIEKEFWIDESGVSPTYLEQFGSFIGQLLLSKSINSASNQRSVLLRHTDVSYSFALRQKLIQEEELLKKQNASYVFFPIEIKVDAQAMEVLLIGDRIYYVNAKQVSTDRESYLLSFTYTGTGLFLKGITAQIKE